MYELSVTDETSQPSAPAEVINTVITIKGVRTTSHLKRPRIRLELDIDGMKCASYIGMKADIRAALPKIGESLQIEFKGQPSVQFEGNTQSLCQNLGIL